MQPLPSFDKSIPAMYFVANTASSFYEMMRNNFFIREVLGSHTPGQLINEFKRRSSEKINDASEVSELYALLVALTFKDRGEVENFFSDVAKNIKFEWFSEIASQYLNNYVPNAIYQQIEIKPSFIDQSFESLQPNINIVSNNNASQ